MSESPIERLTGLARHHGFNGKSGQELLAFLDQRLSGEQQAKAQLRLILESVPNTMRPGCDGDPLIPKIQQVISELLCRVSAQQATIQILMAELDQPSAK